MRIPFLTMRERLYYRYYGRLADKFTGLYQDASLALAPQVHLRLVSTDIGHRWIALTGFYELSLTWIMAKLAKKGGLLIDAGANFGYYSCLWAGMNLGNRVIAFEPSPRCLPGLKFNIERNDFQTRIKIKEAALGRENGIAKFSLGPPEQSGWGGLVMPDGQGEAQVEVVRLDDIYGVIDSPGYIDVLKIDVEGADTWVLLGAEKLLKDKMVRHIFFEENPVRMKALNIRKTEAIEFLRSCGYRTVYLTKGLLHATIDPRG
jgi:FkbM family methyltransferase